MLLGSAASAGRSTKKVPLWAMAEKSNALSAAREAMESLTNRACFTREWACMNNVAKRGNTAMSSNNESAVVCAGCVGKWGHS